MSVLSRAGDGTQGLLVCVAGTGPAPHCCLHSYSGLALCLRTAYFLATSLPHSVRAPRDGAALLLNLTILLLIWLFARDSPSVPRVGINLQWVHTDTNYSEPKSLLRDKYLHVSGKCFQMTSLRFFCFKVSLWWISREWRCTGRV